MVRRRVLLPLLVAIAAVFVAVSPARADGVLYIVTGTGDGSGSCGPYPGVPGAFACTTLRVAVDSSGANDVVGLPSGTYTLSQGALAITKSTIITGGNAHDTIIQGNGADRVMSIGIGAALNVSGVTISGGRAGAQNGGNILNQGSLVLFNTRVTDGQAATGGGIATTGSLQVIQSLIDANTADPGQGGGIAIFGATATISDSTLFGNVGQTAAAIVASGDGGQLLSLLHTTIANNNAAGGSDPGGIAVGGGTWTSYGSLLIGNRGDNINNCSTPADAQSADNIEDDSSCGFAANNVQNTGLATTLSDQGGHTPVLTIPANSPAKGFVNPCGSGFDQRFAQRNLGGACDAGAYEQGAVAPPVTGFQIPQPPAPTPTPPPPPPPTATPVAGKSVAGKTVEGKVLVKTPGGKFVALDPTKPIPLGSTIDTTDGTILLTAQQKKNGKPQSSKFFDGIFKITQTKTTTDLTLNEALANCATKSAHAAAKKKPKTRKLWGDGSGSFRTRGQYSAATVRGTRWLVQDSCAGTLTQVKKGVVEVRDNVKRKTIILRAGKKYLAKPRR
jgi:hypothetical protein